MALIKPIRMPEKTEDERHQEIKKELEGIYSILSDVSVRLLWVPGLLLIAIILLLFVGSIKRR
jgi:hypothetical protein